MRKHLVTSEPSASEQAWLNLVKAATLELTSEDETHPIEAALSSRDRRGWRASGPRNADHPAYLGSAAAAQGHQSGIVQTRNFSMFMLYRMFRDKPVLSLTKVNSVLDDAEQHAGAYDFYIFTGGTGEMIVGGKIANQQNLQDKDGIIPGEYRGQPVVGAQTYKVKAGDW